MKILSRALPVALLLAALVAPITRAEPSTCAPATCIDVTLDMPAGTTAPTPTARILLPTGYDANRSDPYPVVFLLHGAGDGSETWVENTDVETFAAGLGAIVVMPDSGGKHSDAGWYTDWADGSRQWETFHIDVLLPWVDANLNTLADREHRAVMGLSMGGFGALSYAARHPDLFGAAASFSGALDTQYFAPASGYGFAAVNPYFGTPDERVWGPQGTELDGANEWTRHNPTALTRAGDLSHLDGNLWITTGTGTPGGPAGDDPANPGGYAVEQFIWQLNQSWRLAATQSATRFHDLSYLGGPHDWPHWEHSLHLVLPEVVAAIS